MLDVCDLKQYLTDRWKLICFVDLSDISSSNRAVFDTIKPLYRDFFKPSQRLVFYTSHRPDQHLIGHLQHALRVVDISFSFVLIVCSHDITDLLQRADPQSGEQRDNIDLLRIDLKPTKPLTSMSYVDTHDSFCSMPWTNLIWSRVNKGTVRPCCRIKGSWGDLNRESLMQIWRGTEAQSLRQAFMQGDRPQACQVCWDLESKGVTSLRQHSNAKYLSRVEQEWFDDPLPRAVEFDPSNLCNFACRICDETKSSKIAAEHNRFNANKIIVVDEMPWSPAEIFTEDVRSVELVHVLGGEPMIWPGMIPMLDLFIERGLSANMKLEIHTNGSVWSEKIMSRIEHFQMVEMVLSIDDIGPRFELQRGGDWDRVLRNLYRFSDIRSEQTKITVCLTVNLQNVLYLSHLVALCRRLGFDIAWWYLHQPTCLSIDNPTQTLKKTVRDLYENHPEPELRKICRRVQMARSTTSQAFIDYMDELDGRRGQDWRAVHPELAASMHD